MTEMWFVVNVNFSVNTVVLEYAEALARDINQAARAQGICHDIAKVEAEHMTDYSACDTRNPRNPRDPKGDKK